MQQQTASALHEAAQRGFHPSENGCSDVVRDQSRIAEIIAYCECFIRRSTRNPHTILSKRLSSVSWLIVNHVIDNSTIDSEQNIDQIETKLIEHPPTPLIPEYTRQLPKSIVNCLLGISVVHMASRNPRNPEIERMALETKVNVLQSHNQLLGMPQNRLDQRPDIVIACAVLIFAMDVRYFPGGLGSLIVPSCLNTD